jgi:hypothetical protein
VPGRLDGELEDDDVHPIARYYCPTLDTRHRRMDDEQDEDRSRERSRRRDYLMGSPAGLLGMEGTELMMGGVAEWKTAIGGNLLAGVGWLLLAGPLRRVSMVHPGKSGVLCISSGRQKGKKMSATLPTTQASSYLNMPKNSQWQ